MLYVGGGPSPSGSHNPAANEPARTHQEGLSEADRARMRMELITDDPSKAADILKMDDDVLQERHQELTSGPSSRI